MLALACARCCGAAPPDFAWLRSADIEPTALTSALQAIDTLSKSDAVTAAAHLAALDAGASAQGRMAAGLLRGVALERAEDVQGARAAYRILSRRGGENSYGTSASFRLRIIEGTDPSGSARAKLFQILAREPERSGWFVMSNRWTWSTTRRAASHALVELNTTRLSFRLFNFLRANSFFPPAYRYLFVLLALAVGVKLLELPLLVRAARATIQIRGLQPEIDLLGSVYRDDPTALQRRVMELYQERGINLSGGCLVFLADMIFVIWALVSLSDFAPQMVLDNARFWWVPDVTQFNAGFAALWLALNSAVSFEGQNRAIPIRQLVWGSLFTGSILLAIAWHWNWPSYVFVFWALLWLVGTFFSRVLMLPLSKSKSLPSQL